MDRRRVVRVIGRGSFRPGLGLPVLWGLPLAEPPEHPVSPPPGPSARLPGSRSADGRDHEDMPAILAALLPGEAPVFSNFFPQLAQESTISMADPDDNGIGGNRNSSLDQQAMAWVQGWNSNSRNNFATRRLLEAD